MTLKLAVSGGGCGVGAVNKMRSFTRLLQVDLSRIKLHSFSRVSIATKNQPFSQVGWGGCDSLIATISLSD